jgi:hypothetical protein
MIVARSLSDLAAHSVSRPRQRIRFDDRMKPGSVTRINAIALMRALGLDLPSSDR